MFRLVALTWTRAVTNVRGSTDRYRTLDLSVLLLPSGSWTVNDFVERHYGDIVAIGLVGAGTVILMLCKDVQCLHLGERLTGAGLIALRLTATPTGKKGDGGGSSSGAVP